MDADLPPPAAIRQLLVDAGCRREFIDTMKNIVVSLACMGQPIVTTIARWRTLKSNWWFF